MIWDIIEWFRSFFVDHENGIEHVKKYIDLMVKYILRHDKFTKEEKYLLAKRYFNPEFRCHFIKSGYSYLQYKNVMYINLNESGLEICIYYFCTRMMTLNYLDLNTSLNIALRIKCPSYEFLLQNKSATCIQRAWRQCIIDPDYLMCKKRLLREFNALQEQDQV